MMMLCFTVKVWMHLFKLETQLLYCCYIEVQQQGSLELATSRALEKNCPLGNVCRAIFVSTGPSFNCFYCQLLRQRGVNLIAVSFLCGRRCREWGIGVWEMSAARMLSSFTCMYHLQGNHVKVCLNITQYQESKTVDLHYLSLSSGDL